jgi:hypothetical protein
VNDAKIVVDRYLEEADRDDGIFRDAVKAAIDYYVLVSSLWNDKIGPGGGYRTASENPLVRQCAPTQKVITTVRHFGPKPGGDYYLYSELGPGERGYLVMAYGLPGLLSCASDKVTEAEQLARRRK